eukprot:m.544976 g.544976  ORF g.544976 m.544976 type:complete len:50 (+) comp22142_c0_seq22:2410-2559(+)
MKQRWSKFGNTTTWTMCCTPKQNGGSCAMEAKQYQSDELRAAAFCGSFT